MILGAIILALSLLPPVRCLTCAPVICDSFDTTTNECLQVADSQYYIQECSAPDYTCPHPSNINSSNQECEYWSDSRIWEASSWQDFYSFSLVQEGGACDPYGLVSVCDSSSICICSSTCVCEKALQPGEDCYGSEIPCITGYVCSNKVCTQQYSLEAGESATDYLACKGGGPLVPTSESFVCREASVTAGGAPKECNIDNDCVSSDGTQFTECECGMNSDGVGYCNLHFGDEAMVKWREAERDNDFEGEIYWKFVSVNWPYLQGNIPPCLGSVWRDYGIYTQGETGNINYQEVLAVFVLYFVV